MSGMSLSLTCCKGRGGRKWLHRRALASWQRATLTKSPTVILSLFGHAWCHCSLPGSSHAFLPYPWTSPTLVRLSIGQSTFSFALRYLMFSLKLKCEMVFGTNRIQTHLPTKSSQRTQCTCFWTAKRWGELLDRPRSKKSCTPKILDCGGQ